MSTVMLAGGRACTTLSPETISAVREAASNGADFVVGDCYGADLLFQQLLKQIGASCVVYHIGYKPRNNVGFPSRSIPGNRYADKDLAMRQAASDIIYEPVGAGPGTMASVRFFKEKEVI